MLSPKLRQRLRIHALFAVFTAALGIIVMRSLQLQVLQHSSLQKLSRDQYLDEVRIDARRGQIFDRNSKPLAVAVDVPSVFAVPQTILDPRQSARKMAEILDLDVTTVYQKLATDRSFVWLKRQVSPEMAAKVESQKIRGIGVTREAKRFYPHKELAAQLLGFTDVDARGIEGIEKSLDKFLSGEPQVVAAVRDGRGHAVLEGILDPEQRSRGADVYLTIDLQIQHAAQIALKEAVQKTHADSAMAVVLDVASSEILAMASVPMFNPNNAAESRPDKRRNRPVTDMFEPGSTLKPITAAAALDVGAVKANAVFFCENGSITIGTHTIRDSQPHAWLSLSGIIERSSNIGIAKVGEQLGAVRLANALELFGFGKRTELPLPGETSGAVRSPTTWSKVGLANISFGHGLAVSALQLASAYRVLAGEGVYRSPQLLRSVVYSDGHREDLQVPKERRVVTAKAAHQVMSMMEAAVGPNGTGKLAAIDGYRVAGKTGTAQKIDSVSGGYSNDRFMALFAGVVPADAPRVVIVTVLDEPEGDHQGGAVAAPVFASIAAATMRQLGVVPKNMSGPISVSVAAPEVQTPTVVAPPVKGTMPSFVGLTALQAVEHFNSLGANLQLEFSGSGKVVRQELLAANGSTPRLRLELRQ